MSTISKVNYTRAAVGGAKGMKTARTKANASAGYYGDRPNELGEPEHRLAFTPEHDDLTLEQVRDEMREVEGRYMYRVMLSPGENLEQHELRQWTREVMLEQPGVKSWHGWVHENTDHKHVHVIAWTEGKLERRDLDGFRRDGDRELERTLEYRKELTQELEHGRDLEPKLEPRLEPTQEPRLEPTQEPKLEPAREPVPEPEPERDLRLEQAYERVLEREAQQARDLERQQQLDRQLELDRQRQHELELEQRERKLDRGLDGPDLGW
jgi:hypothetical protein